VRRFGRILFNTATVLSLVLCVATIALWVRSQFVVEFFAGYTGNRGQLRTIDLLGDGIYYSESVWAARVNELPGWQHWSVRRYDSIAVYRTTFDPQSLGYFDVWAVPFFSTTFVPANPRDTSGWTLRAQLPWWLLFLATATLPISRMTRALRARRRRGGGLCPACGYDLRATPDRCPECGATPPPPPPAQQPPTPASQRT
jgi:hypothetical protein